MFIRGIVAISAGMIVVVGASYGADVLLATAMPNAFDMSGRVGDPILLSMMIGYGALAAGLAGWVVAVVARGAARSAGTLFALLLLAASVATTLPSLDTAPLWYHAASIGATFMAAIAGAWVRAPRRQSALLTHSPTK